MLDAEFGGRVDDEVRLGDHLADHVDLAAGPRSDGSLGVITWPILAATKSTFVYRYSWLIQPARTGAGREWTGVDDLGAVDPLEVDTGQRQLRNARAGAG